MIAATVALFLAACASKQPAPVDMRAGAAPPPPPAATAPAPAAAPESEARPTTYTVKRGDTLAQIALDNGLDYREVAAWNNLDNPNLIRAGQVLRLTPPAGAAASPTVASTPTSSPTPPRPPVAAAPASPTPAPAPAASAARADGLTKSSPKALREPYSEQALREVALASNVAPPVSPPQPAPAAAPAGEAVALATPPGPRSEPPKPAPSGDVAVDDDTLEWIWPAKGKVVGTFSESANLKGIDIAGASGAPIVASAPGRVVYAGSGLRGYGKLVIIKHNKTYLSAYAHNRELLVKEGDQVAKGQKIAEMGNTDSDQVKLHFEIRRMGKPMDPARYLPPA